MSDEKELTKEIAEQFLVDEDSVDLSEFTAIEDDAAEVLAKHEGGELNLTSVTSISSATAEFLSKLDGALILDGIEQLPDTLAESLGKHQDNLLLNGLTSLSDAAAEMLMKHEGQLWLDGLSGLSDAAAESLSKHRGDLYLNGVTSLSDAAAMSLSRHGFELQLTGLENITDETARIFNSATGELHLPDATSLASLISEGHAISNLAFTAALNQEAINDFISNVDTVGSILCSTHNDEYGHYLYNSISSFQIRIKLAKSGGRITASIAKELVELEDSFEEEWGDEQIPSRPLSDPYASLLKDVVSIDDTAAEILCSSTCNLYLNSLSTLSAKAAATISEHEAELEIDLDNLPESAAAILRKHPSFADED